MHFHTRTGFVLILGAITLALTACGGRGQLPAGNSATSSLQSAANAGGADQTTLTYYNVPNTPSFPWSMINGPDGAIWFGDWTQAPGSITEDGRVGRLDPVSGSIAEFDAPGPSSTPILGAISDGKIWFSEYGSTQRGPGALANITTGGAITAYPLTSDVSPMPRFSAAASDGNVWYTLFRTAKVARITPSGAITEFALPPSSSGPDRPNDIIVGPDGALWITEFVGNAIARMTLDGSVTNVFAIPTAEAFPRFIASGTDGNLWFTENGSAADSGDSFTPPQIVRMTTSGSMSTYAMPSSASVPDDLRPATGGFVFIDDGTNAVGLIDYSGNVVEYPLALMGANGIQSGLQGNDSSYYFTDDDQGRIGKITLGKKGLIFPQAFTIAGAGNTQLVGVAVLGDRGPFSASIDNTSVATVTPISGFPMNFNVTAVGPGTATLTIKGKGKPMTASVTVTSGAISAFSIRKKPLAPSRL